MAADHPTMPQPQFRDRSVGLIVFGGFQLVLAGGCAMMIFPMLATARTNPQAGIEVIPIVGLYSLLAVLFAGLGVGSMLARRWARVLTLVLAWHWLVIGSFISIMMIFVMPAIWGDAFAGPGMPAGGMYLFVLILTATLGCMYILLPSALILFYRSPDVRATCEFRDPGPSWTDRCPLPVLALSVMMGSWVLSLPMAMSSNLVFPFFGTFLTGAPAVAVMVANTLLCAYLAWGTYKLKLSAWWTTLVLFIAFSLSSIVTFLRVDLIDFYRALEIPQESLDQIEKMPYFSSFNMALSTAVIMLATVGYMLWIRRYFDAKPPSQPEPSAS